jgi:hypothetical protein
MTSSVQRLCVGIFAPAPLGALLTSSVNAVDALRRHRLEAEDLLWMPLMWIGVSVGAYLMVGIQSILMEYVVNPRLRKDGIVIAASALLGALSGAAMPLVFPKWDGWFIGIWVAVGVIVGAVMGYVLRHMYRRQHG